MTSVILASADEQLRAVLMGIPPPPGTPPAALSLRKYHYPRCLSSRIHREQSDGRARTLDTIRRLELVTQSLACEGNSGNVSAEGVFGCQGTGHRCFLCRSYDQVQMKTHDLSIIPHPESLVKRFQDIFLYLFFVLIYCLLNKIALFESSDRRGTGRTEEKTPAAVLLHMRAQRHCGRASAGGSRCSTCLRMPSKSSGRGRTGGCHRTTSSIRSAVRISGIAHFRTDDYSTLRNHFGFIKKGNNAFIGKELRKISIYGLDKVLRFSLSFEALFLGIGSAKCIRR